MRSTRTAVMAGTVMSLALAGAGTAQALDMNISSEGLIDYFNANTGVTLDGTEGTVQDWTNQGPGSDIFVGDEDADQGVPVTGPSGQTMIRFNNPDGPQPGPLRYGYDANNLSLDDGYTVFVVAQFSQGFEAQESTTVRLWGTRWWHHQSLAYRSSGEFGGTIELRADESEKSAHNVDQRKRFAFDSTDPFIVTATVLPNSQALYLNGELMDTSAHEYPDGIKTPDEGSFNSGFDIGAFVGDIGAVAVYDHSLSISSDPNTGINQTGAALADAYGLEWTVIPEPGAAGLLAAGCLLMLRRRR